MEEQKGNISVSDNSETKIGVQQAEPLAASVDSHEPETGGAATAILRRWKTKDMLRRGSLGLRGIALLFSLISLILMAGNQHGYLQDFHDYQEYRYLVAVAILSSLYNAVQVFRQVRELSTGKSLIEPITAGLIDFVGDQVAAYLLMSSTSSAIPATNSLRLLFADSIFTDSSAAAIAFSFFAFLCVALSAVMSGYKLSTQTYM